MIHDIEITVTTLTPLHIGTGRTLTRNFDFRSHRGTTYRLSDEGMIDALYARDPKITEQLMRTPPGELLKIEDLDPKSPFVRYALPGQPKGREFREQIKDVHDRPYLPGSSLKGALRTVIAWHGWKEQRLSLKSVYVGGGRSAAKDIEGKIFGRDPKRGRHSPHYDLLRALHIADSSSVATAALMMEQVHVVSQRRQGASIDIEAVSAGTKFVVQGSFDESIFSHWASKRQGFPLPHSDWLHNIPAIARARAAERIKRELSWWRGGSEPVKLREIQSSLGNASEDSFPLQLGFGTGWEGTTIGAPVTQDSDWPSNYKRLNLGYIPRRKEKVRVEDFPSSRRMIIRNRTQLIPLGWVWITWKEEK